jgi:hypothetical protein
MTQLVELLECECKVAFTWKTKATYKNHFKSVTHKSYITCKQEKDHRKTIVDMQNKISKLTIEIELWKDQCIRLKNQQPVDPFIGSLI